MNAFLITRMKIIPFMVTLGYRHAGRGLGLLITQSRHISVPEQMRWGADAVGGLIPIPILILVMMIAVAWIILNYTPLGRQIYAYGNDPEAAKKAGLNTTRITGLYIFSAPSARQSRAVIAISQQGSVSASFGQGVNFGQLPRQFWVAPACSAASALFSPVRSLVFC